MKPGTENHSASLSAAAPQLYAKPPF